MAATNPIEHLVDKPWRINGHEVPWLSSHIAIMVLAALLLAVGLPLVVRRRVRGARHGSLGLVEMIVLFVREQIARPAMGDRAAMALPYLLTLFMFVLLCNLLGLVPLAELFSLAGLNGWGGTLNGQPRFSTPIGGTPTSGLWVCAALAIMTFCILLLWGYFKQVRQLWKGPASAHGHEDGHGHAVAAGANVWLASSQALQRRAWPLPVAVVLAGWTWLNSFVPSMSGVVGLLMWPFLLVIEVIGYVTKCFALCIRLLANETGGHMMLAVLLMFAQNSRGWHVALVGLPAGLGVLAMTVMELMVAVLQAYIFTFLSALFIGMAVSAEH